MLPLKCTESPTPPQGARTQWGRFWQRTTQRAAESRAQEVTVSPGPWCGGSPPTQSLWTLSNIIFWTHSLICLAWEDMSWSHKVTRAYVQPWPRGVPDTPPWRLPCWTPQDNMSPRFLPDSLTGSNYKMAHTIPIWTQEALKDGKRSFSTQLLFHSSITKRVLTQGTPPRWPCWLHQSPDKKRS